MTVFVSSTGGGGSSSSSLTTRLANDGFVIMGACIVGIIMSETAIGPAVGLALAIADLLQYRAGKNPPPTNPTVAQSQSPNGPFNLMTPSVNPSNPFNQTTHLVPGGGNIGK